MVTVLTKKEQKRVLSIFKNTTKDARKIAEELSVPRFSVMRFLENEGLRNYSPGSYNFT